MIGLPREYACVECIGCAGGLSTRMKPAAGIQYDIRSKAPQRTKDAAGEGSHDVASKDSSIGMFIIQEVKRRAEVHTSHVVVAKVLVSVVSSLVGIPLCVTIVETV